MKNYSITYPRTFAFVDVLDVMLEPWGVLAHVALLCVEIREFFHDLNHLSPLFIAALTISNVIYFILFNLFTEKKGQTFLVNIAGKFKQKLARTHGWL